MRQTTPAPRSPKGVSRRRFIAGTGSLAGTVALAGRAAAAPRTAAAAAGPIADGARVPVPSVGTGSGGSVAALGL
ncbi:GMC family oxidoreductase, partial [Streptomyces sp. NPDC059786]